MLKNLLKISPENRFSAQEAFSHRWFENSFIKVNSMLYHSYLKKAACFDANIFQFQKRNFNRRKSLTKHKSNPNFMYFDNRGSNEAIGYENKVEHTDRYDMFDLNEKDYDKEDINSLKRLARIHNIKTIKSIKSDELMNKTLKMEELIKKKGFALLKKAGKGSPLDFEIEEEKKEF